VYERGLIVQLHRLPFVGENWKEHLWEVSRSSLFYSSGKISSLITATFAYTCVEFAVSGYEL
jgi:hypothetical protein